MSINSMFLKFRIKYVYMNVNIKKCIADIKFVSSNY